MKKIIPALVLSLILTFSLAPRKSEAGLLIGSLVGAPMTGLAIGAIIGVASYGGAVIFVNGARHDTFFLFGGSSTFGMALLDVDATLTPDHLTDLYKESFPFVDNAEVINELTQMTKDKFHSQVTSYPDGEQVLVHFTADELAPIFANTDITDAQFAEVVQQLE